MSIRQRNEEPGVTTPLLPQTTIVAERRTIKFNWGKGIRQEMRVELVGSGTCTLYVNVNDGQGLVSATLDEDARMTYHITVEIENPKNSSRNAIKTMVHRKNGNGERYDLVGLMQPNPAAFLSGLNEQCVITFNIYHLDDGGWLSNLCCCT